MMHSHIILFSHSSILQKHVDNADSIILDLFSYMCALSNSRSALICIIIITQRHRFAKA